MRFEKYCLFVCLVVLLAPRVRAQGASAGTVAGVAVDSASGAALAFANAGLYNKRDGSLAKGMVTDKNGAFNLAGIADGEYFMRITLMGYKAATTQAFLIDPKHLHANLGKVSLA